MDLFEINTSNRGFISMALDAVAGDLSLDGMPDDPAF
jgi:hypothetical protein